MRYTSGNYEAFVHPKKPAGVDQKSAYIVGAGLAGLAAAFFLIRDGQMSGDRIHILEELDISGGSLDGKPGQQEGFVVRGGREMENHFECFWDMFGSVPSLELEGASVLDEFYYLDREDPNSSNCRIIHNRGERASDDGKFTLTPKALEEISKIFMTREEHLVGKSIEDCFSEEFFESNFWLYWSTMFAFEKWHSAIEMRRYIIRFVHHTEGLPDFTAIKFTRYNQYESFVKPLLAYLESHQVDFRYEAAVSNLDIDLSEDKKVVRAIHLSDGKVINLTEEDLVFVTNGSITESSTEGSSTQAAPISKEPGPSWTLWENLAAQSKEFGNPEAFYQNIPDEAWFVSATITWENLKIEPYMERLTQRKLQTGKIVTGGIVTIKDSNWMMSFATHRQPHFKEQTKEESTTWVYALTSNTPGNYVKKPIEACTGHEIAQELLYHLGMPEDEIEAFARENTTTVPVYMPFITSYFMLREPGDRPLVIPENSVNLAFMGNFTEIKRDTVFTTEYSVRSAMEAVYQLVGVDRGVPEVFASGYDLRALAGSVYQLLDKKKLSDTDLPLLKKEALKLGLKKIKGTYLEEILEDAGLV